MLAFTQVLAILAIFFSLTFVGICVLITAPRLNTEQYLVYWSLATGSFLILAFFAARGVAA